VRDQLEGKVEASFRDLGEHAVKSLRRPVQVFALEAPQLEAPVAAKSDPARSASICVLPFVNMSGESEQEYFSDGITEDIITDLTKVSAVWVAARNTAFMFKGKHVDVPQIARQLKVGHVLEGSVRKAGGRVRITAQLIDASGGHIWAERYDRDLNDIFALQDEISQAIVQALKVKLLPQEKQAIERRGATNAEAYELYLLARQFLRTGSERMKPLIVRICQRVAAADPNFARNWALMSMAESEASQRGAPGFSFEAAKDAAERAVALDPGLAEAHAALAEALLRGPAMDATASLASVETALALDPNCYEAQLIGGYAHYAQQRYEDSVRCYEAAVALDASACRPAGMVMSSYYALGDRQKLTAAARRCAEVCEGILRAEPDHGGAMGFLVGALIHLGETERARGWAKRAVLFDPDNARMHYNIACGFAEAGDTDMVVALLDNVLSKVSLGWLRWIAIDTDLDPVRDDPRFKALLEAAEARLAAKAQSA
jgi:adenylate cyclase